jgi:transmembrane sensor
MNFSDMNQYKSDIEDRQRLDEQTERLLKELKVPAKRSKEDAWAAISSAIATPPAAKRRWFTPTITWTVAASFALLVAVGSLILTHTTHVACAKGERLAVVLPDGSNVLLNSESQLSYQKYMWWQKREVALNGEGFFKVMKGRRFEVRTGKYVTSVLGTSFNVFARDNTVRVCCFTGKVGVREVTSGAQAILTPGLGVGGQGSTLGGVEKISEKQKGWTKGEFYFSDAALDDVFAEIERQFNVKVSCTGCENRRYSGYFNDKSLSQALELVCIPMQLTYNVASNGEVKVNPAN